jgi:hypothetical protein
MKNLLILSALLLLIATGCSKDQADNGNNPPGTPDPKYYDFDNDGIDDFIIEYIRFTWDGVGASGDGLAGRIVPLNGNLILTNHNEFTLFNEKNDILRIEVEPPLDWISFGQDLVMMQNSSENGFLWPDEWAILSREPEISYYLGLIIQREIPRIGWIKLMIQTSSGNIRITDKEFTKSDHILISR